MATNFDNLKTKWSVVSGDTVLLNSDNSLFWTTDIRYAKDLAVKHKGHIVETAKLLRKLMQEIKQDGRRNDRHDANK